MSIDTAGSQISESEISATLASLRERFEAVRRGEIQRVRGRLGNLSPDQENAIDSLTHALIERELQASMAMLKERERRQSDCLRSRDGAKNLESTHIKN